MKGLFDNKSRYDDIEISHIICGYLSPIGKLRVSKEFPSFSMSEIVSTKQYVNDFLRSLPYGFSLLNNFIIDRYNSWYICGSKVLSLFLGIDYLGSADMDIVVNCRNCWLFLDKMWKCKKRNNEDEQAYLNRRKSNGWYVKSETSKYSQIQRNKLYMFTICINKQDMFEDMIVNIIVSTSMSSHIPLCNIKTDKITLPTKENTSPSNNIVVSDETFILLLSGNFKMNSVF